MGLACDILFRLITFKGLRGVKANIRVYISFSFYNKPININI